MERRRVVGSRRGSFQLCLWFLWIRKLRSPGTADAATLTDTADAATLTAMRVPGYVDEW